MLHIIEHFEHLESLIIPLSNDYAQDVGVHFCTTHHRDVLCCRNAQTMQDGASPTLTVVYISPTLYKGARIIANHLRHYFPQQTVNNPSFALMFTCPGCGLPFAQQ